MWEELAKGLLSGAPQAAGMLVIVIGGWMLVREYGKFSQGVESLVDRVVSRQIGALVGDIQQEVNKVAQVAAASDKRRAEVDGIVGDFRRWIAEQQSAISEQYSQVAGELADIRSAVPTRAEMEWTSPRDLIAGAARASTWAEASSRLKRVYEDPNSTPDDHIAAGRIAEDQRSFIKAKQFYERALERDPGHREARVRLLCLKAELDSTQRATALKEAGATLNEGIPSQTMVMRFANACYHLDAYEPLREAMVQQLRTPLSKDVEAQVYRDLATALRKLGSLSEAEDCFRKSLERDPVDENTLMAYSGFLREQGRAEECEKVLRRLLYEDPFDYRYHLALGEDYEERGDNEAARLEYEEALTLAKDQHTKTFVDSRLKIVKRRIELGLQPVKL